MKFSIVTVCRNAEKQIEATMRSVLNQEYSDYEYILVDGASTDSTNAIIQRMKELFEKRGISVVHQSEKDEGISDAFNKGVKLSKGEYVILVNAGDRLTANALKTVAENAGGGEDVLYGNILWQDKEKNIEYIRRSKEKPDTIVYEMSIMHPSAYIRKSAYEKYGYYKVDFRYSMDRDLLARMYTEGASFKYIDATLSIMESGGVSDAIGKIPRKKEESKQISRENGVSAPRFYFIYYRAIVSNNLKQLIKGHFGKLYQYLKSKG